MTTITYVVPSAGEHTYSIKEALHHFAPAICSLDLVVNYDIKMVVGVGFKMVRHERAGNGRGGYKKQWHGVVELTFRDERQAQTFHTLQKDIDLGVARLRA